MSKTTLKKTLAGLDRDQIAELVVDLYSARPEAKEYLDFWISGDIDSKMMRAKANIAKEVARTQRGRLRPRMTRVRRFIKDISSLKADAQAVSEIMAYAVEAFCRHGSEAWIKEATQKSVARLLHDTLVYAGNTGELPAIEPRLREAIGRMSGDVWWSRDFADLLKTEFDDTLYVTAQNL